MNILKTKENISTIALAYLDEIDGSLKEISENNLYIAVPSFKRIIKRFYLIGDFLYNYNIVIEAYTDQVNYEVKVALGGTKKSLSVFDNSSNTLQLQYHDCDFRYLNAVPIDFEITNNSIADLNNILDINIQVKDDFLVNTLRRELTTSYLTTENFSIIQLGDNI